MMVDWAAVPSGHGSLADVDLTNMHDFTQLTGTISSTQHGDLGSYDGHSGIYPGLSHTETITGSWTYEANIVLKKAGQSIALRVFDNDSPPTVRGKIYGFYAIVSTFIIEGRPGTNIEINAVDSDREVKLGVAGSWGIRVTYSDNILAQLTIARSIYPTTDCTYYLGEVGTPRNWAAIRVGTCDDLNCSVYPEPQNAFEVLATLKHFLGEGAPKGKIDSKNIPAPLRPWNKKKGKPEKMGRSLSTTVTYLMYAMGDIKEIQDNFEQRLKLLEQQT